MSAIARETPASSTCAVCGAEANINYAGEMLCGRHAAQRPGQFPPPAVGLAFDDRELGSDEDAPRPPNLEALPVDLAVRKAAILNALYEIREEAADLRPDRETRETVRRLERARRAQGRGPDDLLTALVDATSTAPSRDRDELIGLTHKIAEDLHLSETRDQLGELKRRADVVIGTPGRRAGLRKATPDQVSRAYWKRAGVQRKRRPTQEDTAEDLGVSPRSIGRMVEHDEITWPPARPKTR